MIRFPAKSAACWSALAVVCFGCTAETTAEMQTVSSADTVDPVVPGLTQPRVFLKGTLESEPVTIFNETIPSNIYVMPGDEAYLFAKMGTDGRWISPSLARLGEGVTGPTLTLFRTPAESINPGTWYLAGEGSTGTYHRGNQSWALKAIKKLGSCASTPAGTGTLSARFDGFRNGSLVADIDGSRISGALDYPSGRLANDQWISLLTDQGQSAVVFMLVQPASDGVPAAVSAALILPPHQDMSGAQVLCAAAGSTYTLGAGHFRGTHSVTVNLVGVKKLSGTAATSTGGEVDVEW